VYGLNFVSFPFFNGYVNFKNQALFYDVPITLSLGGKCKELRGNLAPSASTVVFKIVSFVCDYEYDIGLLCWNLSDLDMDHIIRIPQIMLNHLAFSRILQDMLLTKH